MEKFYLRKEDEYIKLGQLLKACSLVESGAAAKLEIQDGYVKVNGNTQYQRGKKLYEGDIVEYEGNEIIICR